MKKHMLGLVVFAMALLAGSDAIAQSNKGDLLVNVPFSFVAGRQQLPAGRYAVTKLTNGFIRLYALRGSNPSVFLGTIGVVSTQRKQPKLIFHRYGDSYFLTQVWSSDWGRELPESKAEKEVASSRTSRISGAEVAVIRADQ